MPHHFKNYTRCVAFAALTLAPTVSSGETSGVRVPTPVGLNSCKDDDAVVAGERRVAASAGAEFLACFTSDEKTVLHGSSRAITLPVEYALAMRVSGGPYGRGNLDAMLAKVRGQWKTFEPLSQAHKDYLARLNSLIKGTGPQAPLLQSEKPTLVSIDKIDGRSYVVVSVREYSIAVGGNQVRSIKANAVAMVLQDAQLVRLEIMRELGSPSDVEDVRTQIAAWSRAVGAGKPNSTEP